MTNLHSKHRYVVTICNLRGHDAAQVSVHRATDPRAAVSMAVKRRFGRDASFVASNDQPDWQAVRRIRGQAWRNLPGGGMTSASDPILVDYVGPNREAP